MPDQPPDWPEVKKSARRVSLRPRVVQIALPPQGTDNLRKLKDRLPRPNAVDIVVAPKAKKGTEISGKQMQELKSGSVRIDARLDLHGMTQTQAHGELMRFMDKQTMRGARILLVITGKGHELKGVLRQQLPGWLMAGPWAKKILTLHPAHQRHGGDGATYVLLRCKIEQQ